MADPRILIALDYSEPKEAEALVARLDPTRCRLKVGKELFTRGGPALVERLQSRGYEIFLDLKFHDIPNTVAGACYAAAELGVWMVNVHALGGRRMMEAARDGVDRVSRPPLLIGVTILTSMGPEDLAEVGLDPAPGLLVERLATLASRSGLDGVVCSPRETEMLRGVLGGGFKLVTPGIRPAGSTAGDQVRITTPADAVRMGSDFLVIGRPITAAPDPLAALAAIEQEMAQTANTQPQP